MLAAPIPCHVGIDNLNTVRFATCLIQNIDYLPRMPFGLIPNGDVLQVFQEHWRAKLTRSVLVSKVKGHATPEDVLEGRATARDKKGNDMSDRYATRGIKVHSSEAIHYSKKCGVREKLRICLQVDINLFLLDMLEANRLTVAKDNRFSKLIGGTTIQVTSASDGSEKPTIKVPTQLGYLETSDVLSTFTVANPHLSMLGVFKRPVIHVVSFLQLLEFKPAAHDTQGISWLELFMIFWLWGGMTPDHKSKIGLRTGCP